MCSKTNVLFSAEGEVEVSSPTLSINEGGSDMFCVTLSSTTGSTLDTNLTVTFEVQLLGKAGILYHINTNHNRSTSLAFYFYLSSLFRSI